MHAMFLRHTLLLLAAITGLVSAGSENEISKAFNQVAGADRLNAYAEKPDFPEIKKPVVNEKPDWANFKLSSVQKLPADFYGENQQEKPVLHTKEHEKPVYELPKKHRNRPPSQKKPTQQGNSELLNVFSSRKNNKPEIPNQKIDEKPDGADYTAHISDEQAVLLNRYDRLKTGFDPEAAKVGHKSTQGSNPSWNHGPSTAAVNDIEARINALKKRPSEGPKLVVPELAHVSEVPDRKIGKPDATDYAAQISEEQARLLNGYDRLKAGFDPEAAKMVHKSTQGSQAAWSHRPSTVDVNDIETRINALKKGPEKEPKWVVPKLVHVSEGPVSEKEPESADQQHYNVALNAVQRPSDYTESNAAPPTETNRQLAQLTLGNGSCEWIYKGCYSFSDVSALLQKVELTDVNPKNCARHCRSLKQPLSAIGWSGSKPDCYCGNKFDTQLRSQSRCGKPCPNNNQEACGGVSFYSIFQCLSAGSSSTGQACTQNKWRSPKCVASTASKEDATPIIKAQAHVAYSTADCSKKCGKQGYLFSGYSSVKGQCTCSSFLEAKPVAVANAGTACNIGNVIQLNRCVDF